MDSKTLIKKTISYGIGALLVVGIIYSFIPKPTLVDLASVETSSIEVTIHGEGKSRVREIYSISAPISGQLLRIEAEPGDLVEAAETVVATIRPQDPTFLDARSRATAEANVSAAEAAKEFAQATLEQRRAELTFAERELERGSELAKNGTISEQMLDQRELQVRMAKTAVQTATSNLNMSDHELEAARAVLTPPEAREDGTGCCVEVFSPVSGEVLRLLHENEGVVQAGTSMLEVGDLNDMELVIDLLSIDAVKVEAGDLAYIENWGGPYRLMGRVKLVEPSGFTKISALGIEEQRVNVLIDLTEERDRWQALGDGFRVESSIVVEKKESVTSVPVSALFRTEGKWSVFKVVEGVTLLTFVELGLRNDQIAEVISGLSVGDQVITHPANTISDDIKVAPRPGLN